MRSKRAAAAAAIVFLLGIAALPGGAQSPTGARLSLKWAFLRSGKGSQVKVMDFITIPSIRAGDSLQIYLEALTAVHIYLFLFDSSKDLFLLYPDDPRAPATPADAGGRILPGEGEWFTIDEATGEEQFYLLASATRLSRLEDLTAAWLRNQKNPDAKARVLEEIKEQRRAHSALAGPVEKGVPMAGTFQSRSAGTKAMGDATLVEARGFYARTLRLSHE